jgi:hypothetical protein
VSSYPLDSKKEKKGPHAGISEWGRAKTGTLCHSTVPTTKYKNKRYKWKVLEEVVFSSSMN